MSRRKIVQRLARLKFEIECLEYELLTLNDALFEDENKEILEDRRDELAFEIGRLKESIL